MPATAHLAPPLPETARRLGIIAEAAREAAASGDLATALTYARMLQDRVSVLDSTGGTSGILAAAEANAAVSLLEHEAVDRALEAIRRVLSEVRAAAR